MIETPGGATHVRWWQRTSTLTLRAWLIAGYLVFAAGVLVVAMSGHIGQPDSGCLTDTKGYLWCLVGLRTTVQVREVRTDVLDFPIGSAFHYQYVPNWPGIAAYLGMGLALAGMAWRNVGRAR